jgi:hypothetical protein
VSPLQVLSECLLIALELAVHLGHFVLAALPLGIN